MTSSNGSIFRVTGLLWGKFTGHRWIPLTKARDAELWCFFDLRLNKQLRKQSRCRWFETLSRSLWHHSNGWVFLWSDDIIQIGWRDHVLRHLDTEVKQRTFQWLIYDDVIKWKHFPRYWPFVRGIHRPPVNSPHKGQWRGALMFSLICVWIYGWINNREAGDLRRYRAHYDVIVMFPMILRTKKWFSMV